MIASFGPDIWIADGPCVEVAGFHYPTRMTVIRLKDGGVMVISPIALDDGLRAAVQALGEVRHILAPNSLHHLALPDWARAFPQARLHAAPGLARKRRDIAFHGELGDVPDPDWAGEVDQVVLRGNLMTTEVVFWHARSRTVIFTDLLQQFPEGWFKGWRGVIARLDGMVGAEPAVPWKFRLAFTDRRSARQAVQKVLLWPADAVLMAHGSPVRTGGQDFLRRAFRWLVR